MVADLCMLAVWLMSVCVCVCVHVRSLTWSVVSDSFAAPWTVAYHVPLSMEFFRQKCWSGLSFSPPGDLANSAIKPKLNLLYWQVDSLPLTPPGKTDEWMNKNMGFCCLFVFLVGREKKIIRFMVQIAVSGNS